MYTKTCQKIITKPIIKDYYLLNIAQNILLLRILHYSILCVMDMCECVLEDVEQRYQPNAHYYHIHILCTHILMTS